MFRCPLTLTAIGVVTFTGCMAMSPIGMAGQASGGDTRERPEPHVEGTVEVERIAFVANIRGDGTAGGEIQYSLKRDGKIVFISHITVECVEFVGDNMAVIGGTVVYDTEPVYIGTAAGILVRDNGAGDGAPADQRTDLSYTLDEGFDYLDCLFFAQLIEDGILNPDEFLTPIGTGNITVDP